MPPTLLDDDDWLVPGFEMILNEVFACFDADGDGSFSVPELQAFVRACNDGEEMDEEEIGQMDSFDTDEKGQMTRRGFFEMMHLQTMARPEDSWADLTALGYDESLTPKSGQPGPSSESAPACRPADVRSDLDERLARTLQLEEDARAAAELAAQLAMEDERAGAAVAARVTAASGKAQKKAKKGDGGGGGGGAGEGGGGGFAQPASSTGNVREERMAGAAHKMIEHLGKGTAKTIKSAFKTDGSLGALLQLMEAPEKRVAVLELVDAGQRERVDAECTALALDLL